MTEQATSPHALPAARLPEVLQKWLIECHLRGVPSTALAAELTRTGLTAAEIDVFVSTNSSGPAAALARDVMLQVQRLDWQARVRRQLLAMWSQNEAVPRVPALARSEFLERYYALNRPVILTGMLERWPARQRWTLDYLKERFGQASIRVAQGRASDPLYDLNTEKLSRTTTVAEFVTWIQSVGESNDRYMVANNSGLANPDLKPLLEDVVLFPDLLDPSRTDGHVYLWLGPAGTVTPLHHDTTNILFCQVRGRKRVKLVDPLHTELLRQSVSYYSLFDPEKPDVKRFPELAGLKTQDVTLDEGEILFIPVGWWHHVRALSPSISVSCTNFVFHNHFEDENPLAAKKSPY